MGSESQVLFDRRQRNIGPPAGVEERRRDERRHITKSGRRATDALKMACPFCGASESAVVRSRGAIVESKIRRRRECASCGERFPTFEKVDYECLERELAQMRTAGEAALQQDAEAQ